MAHHYYHHHHNADRAFAPHNPARRATAPTPVPGPSRAPHARPTAHHVRAPSHTPHTLDPLLVYHTQPGHAPLDFDVTLPPTQITLSYASARGGSSYTGISPRHLSPPAVSPPVPSLRISCSLLPWPIDVHPAHAGGAVSVGDVLDAIYRALRHHVSEGEWRAASHETQEGVRRAWQRRCKRQRSHKERSYEESQGLRRVDWLMRNTVFQGLSPARARDHWVMHVKQGEKMVKFATGS